MAVISRSMAGTRNHLNARIKAGKGRGQKHGCDPGHVTGHPGRCRQSEPNSLLIDDAQAPPDTAASPRIPWKIPEKRSMSPRQAPEKKSQPAAKDILENSASTVPRDQQQQGQPKSGHENIEPDRRCQQRQFQAPVPAVQAISGEVGLDDCPSFQQIVYAGCSMSLSPVLLRCNPCRIYGMLIAWKATPSLRVFSQAESRCAAEVDCNRGFPQSRCQYRPRTNPQMPPADQKKKIPQIPSMPSMFR